MKTFFKENFALVIGIALPLVLILVFTLAGQATKSLAEDPQYSGIIATNYYPNRSNKPYFIKVEDGNLTIRKNDPPENPHPHYNPPIPNIYVFDHETMQAEPIDINFGMIEDGYVSDPRLEELNRKTISSNLVSPDGYEFFNRRGHHNGFFGSVFGFGPRNRNEATIRKNGRIVPIRMQDRFYNPYFIGWITDNE